MIHFGTVFFLLDTDQEELLLAQNHMKSTQLLIPSMVFLIINILYNIQNLALGEIQSKKKIKKLKEYLKKILILRKQDKIELLDTGMYIQSQWGQMPFNALSDGYQSLTTVILDFFKLEITS